MKKIVCLLAILALFAIIDLGDCLNCYVCSSVSDPKCFRPVKNNMATHDCKIFDYLKKPTPTTRFYCLKLTTQIMAIDVVIRKCALVYDDQDDCKNAKKGNNHIKECRLCDKDGCNA